MKTTLLAAAIAAVALPSFASAQDSSDFSFIIDAATGEVVFDVSAPVAGFELVSASGALLPANAPFAGGNPASGLLLVDPGTFTVFSFLSSIDDNFNFAAGNTGAALQPGVLDGFNLGNIVDVSAYADLGLITSDLSATFIAADNTPFENVVLTFINVPEPATAGVLGMVALGMLRRRRAA